MKFAVKRFFNLKLDLILPIIVGLILRIYHLDFLSFWRDEAFSANLAQNSIPDLINITIKDTQPPLHTLILHFWIQIFGNSEVALRSVSVIFGLLTLIFIYLIALNLFKSRKWAFIASFVAATNPLLIVYSQEARQYSLLIFFVTLAVYLFIKFNESPTLLKSILLGIVYSLALYTHYIFIFVIATLGITEVIRLGYINKSIIKILSTKEMRLFLFTNILSVLIYLPWLLVFFNQFSNLGSNGFWLTFKPLEDLISNLPRFFTSQVDITNYNNISLFSFTICIFFGFGFALLGIIKDSKNFRKEVPLISLLPILMIGIIYIISFKYPFFYIRYLTFISPVILILLVNGLTYLRKLIGKTLTLGLVTIFIFSSSYIYFFEVSQDKDIKEDYRSALEYIDTTPSDIILHSDALTMHGFIFYKFPKSYIYNSKENVPYFQGLAILNPDDYYTGSLKMYRRIWFVHIGDYADLDNKFAKEGFIRESSKDFNGNLKVDLFVRSN